VLDVTIAPSPLWLRFRLESLGVRAISNVVDLTNLILLEHSQPMHAFSTSTACAAGRSSCGARLRVSRSPRSTAWSASWNPDDLVIAGRARARARSRA
jgi:phenylalanyl-tRNA synthetase beta subunit